MGRDIRLITREEASEVGAAGRRVGLQWGESSRLAWGDPVGHSGSVRRGQGIGSANRLQPQVKKCSHPCGEQPWQTVCM